MSSTRFAHAIQADGAAPKAGGTRGPTRTYAARTLANISAHIRARRSFSPEFPSDIAPTQLGREGSYKQPPKPPRHGITAGLLWLTACIAGDQPTSPPARQARRITGRKTAEQSAIHAHILRSFSCFYFGSPTAYPYLRPMTRYLCAGVGVVVRILINILAGRECACVCV